MKPEENIPRPLPLIRLNLFTETGRDCLIDRTGRSCDCSQFAADGHCKHLDELGIYQPRHFTARTHPTFSQALSGLVKSIRLRRTDDAIYWLKYLDEFPASEKLGKKAARFRIARRIFIASAEDGHSIAVMEKVAAAFKSLCKLDTPLFDLAAEIVRITALGNWWHPSTSGPDYIYSSLVGYRQQVLYRKADEPEAAKDLLRKAIENKDRANAIGALCLLGALGLSATRQAEFLMPIAHKNDNENAMRLLRIHLGARTALSGDNNFTSQAAWMLAGGDSPTVDLIQPVAISEVYELLERSAERWKHPLPIPHEYCDGIHCAGKDRRYAGILTDMWAVCLAYNRYGNIDPANEWLPDFFPTDGLQVEPVLQSTAAAINCTTVVGQDAGPGTLLMQQTAHTGAFSDPDVTETHTLPTPING